MGQPSSRSNFKNNTYKHYQQQQPIPEEGNEESKYLDHQDKLEDQSVINKIDESNISLINLQSQLNMGKKISQNQRHNSSFLYNEDDAIDEEDNKDNTLIEDSGIASVRSRGDLMSTMKDRGLSI